MMRRPIQCAFCEHFRSPLDVGDGTGGPTCTAFPTGIPDPIWLGEADHREPYPGDSGVRWAGFPGAEFPDYALSAPAKPGALGELSGGTSDARSSRVSRARLRAVVAREVQAILRHLPGRHPQDSHGNDVGVDVIPGDKLKLAGKIDLKPGEKLLSSRRIRSGQWDVLAAEIDTPNGRQVRLGVIDPSDRRNWTGGPDPKRSERVRQLDQQMAAMEKELGDVALDTDEYDRLRDERDELAGTSGDLNRTTSLTSAQVGQMRSDIEAGIAEARAMLARDKRPDNGEFASGVMTGGLDGDVQWRIDEAGMSEGADDWVLWLAIRPHSEGDDWLPEVDDTASFDPKNINALLKAMEELSGDPNPQPS